MALWIGFVCLPSLWIAVKFFLSHFSAIFVEINHEISSRFPLDGWIYGFELRNFFGENLQFN